MRRLRGTRLAAAVVLLGWVGLLLYVWVWSRRDWGVGWALVGTVNFTLAALLALLLIWLGGRIVRRFGCRR
ncbi:MAG: hypothetical protein ACJ75G_08525 [Gaiellaceae bacterium]|jgi:hypothetical protein